MAVIKFINAKPNLVRSERGAVEAIEFDDSNFALSVDSDGNVTIALTAATQAALPQKRSLTIAFGDLTEEETSQVFDVGEELPANAIITGVRVDVTEAFTDGATGAFTIDLGVTDAEDELVNGDALDTIAVVEEAAHCKRRGGVQLLATIAADVDVDTATEGSVDIEVFFHVLA